MNAVPFLNDPLFILLIGIVIVVGGIIGLKLHPFLALLLGALVVAIMTPGAVIEHDALAKGATPTAARILSGKSIGERIALEFGNTCGKLGILIAMAAIIGKCMLESGAAERIVRSLLKLTGIGKAPVAFLVSSFFIGIPVFFDTVIFLMIPLAKAMTMRIGKNYLLFVLAIMAGASMANSLVPPAPGPLFLVTEMQIPIGMMMVAGFLLGVITMSSGYVFALYANRKWPVPLRDSLDARLEDIRSASLKEDTQLPPLWLSLLPILIPLVLICANTALTSLSSLSPSLAQSLTSSSSSHVPVTASSFSGGLIRLLKFFGDKYIALSAGGLTALVLLVRQKRSGKEGMSSFVQAALMSGGAIILITAAGGTFGGMLQQSGISARIAELTSGYQMALIPLAFLVAAIVRTAQGSATVAVITASGMLSGMATHGHLAYHPLYLGLAIGCGAKLVPWMNDAGFWIVCKISNLTEREALKTISPMQTIMGGVGLIVILVAAKLLPLV
ncbi:MAG TPA: SLC13 family permease [Puia sp.]|nr:SLC13 family permease [Puia sp.]